LSLDLVECQMLTFLFGFVMQDMLPMEEHKGDQLNLFKILRFFFIKKRYFYFMVIG
jgi:hypothetical protein